MACKKNLHPGKEEALMLWLMGAIRHLINRLSDILPHYLLTRVRAAEALDRAKYWYRSEMGLKMGSPLAAVNCWSMVHWYFCRVIELRMSYQFPDEWPTKWLGVILRRFIVVDVMGFVHYKKIVSIVDIIFHIVSGRSSSGADRREGWVYSHKYNVSTICTCSSAPCL